MNSARPCAGATCSSPPAGATPIRGPDYWLGRNGKRPVRSFAAPWDSRPIRNPSLAALSDRAGPDLSPRGGAPAGEPGGPVRNRGDKTDLIVSPLDKLEEPPSLIRCGRRSSRGCQQVDLPEILLEIAARTGFTDAFTHLTERTARVEDLATSVCAVLLAEACNTGPEPSGPPGRPALRRDRLAWVDQNYLRDDTLIAANATLVAAQNRIALAQAWGGGEVASADGLRFVVPVRTVHAGPNPKYFGYRPRRHLVQPALRPCSGLNAITVPGTLRDSLILAGRGLGTANRTATHRRS